MPVGAGGVHDVYARFLAREAEKELKKPVVVVNRPGGGTIVGTTEGIAARPDGYTLTWLMTGAGSITPLVSAVPYTLDQIRFVMKAVSEPHVLMVPTNAPPKNLREFFEWSRHKREQRELWLRTGATGAASTPSLGAMRLAMSGKTNFNIVPGYASMAEVASAVANDHLDFGLIPVGLSERFVREGRVRIIALLSDERNPVFSDIATAKEQGHDVSVVSWGGIIVPKDTPENRVKEIHDAFKKALESEDVQRRIRQMGGGITYKDSVSWREWIVKEREINTRIIDRLRAEGLI